MSTQPDSTPAAPAEAPDKGVGCDALFGVWSPINTAPKDGSRILVWLAPNEVDMPSKAKATIGYWKKVQWKNGLGEVVGDLWWMWKSEGEPEPMSMAPTHWMPLPSSPNMEMRNAPSPEKKEI